MPTIVYRLTQSADCEGRGRRTVGFFNKKSLAEQVGDSGFLNAGMGGASDASVEEVTVYGNLSEFVRDFPSADAVLTGSGRQADLRAAALKKLTPAEREALGLP